MSFSLDVSLILKYAYNIFASADPILYLFVGASFGVYVLAKLVNMARG